MTQEVEPVEAGPGEDVGQVEKVEPSHGAGPVEAGELGEGAEPEPEDADDLAGPALGATDEPYDYRRGGRGGRRRRWPAILPVVLVTVVVVAVLGFLHVNNEINPSGKPGRTVMVAVPTGTSTSRAADLLAKDGVIHGSTVFEWYLKLKGVGTLVPGTYQMATNEPYSTALYILQKARSR